MAKARAVIIGGVEFPVAYNGYRLSRNKIWSSNTGRNDEGDMVGTLIAIKTKIEIKLVPITPEQAEMIDSVVSDINNPFPTVRMLFLNGSYRDITAYTGDITFNYLSRAIGENGLITDTALSIIEK